MVAVLTGDIINSRSITNPELWLEELKEALNLSKQTKWEIFRGDSFQLELVPEEALLQALFIKASIKTIKNLDVRIAIGIGKKAYAAEKLTESNGEAFIFSGEKLEELKRERTTLALKTPWPDFDEEINIVLRLAQVIINSWSITSSELVKLALKHPGSSQKELAELSNKSQSSVSEGLKRAHFSEILALNNLYKKKLSQFIAAL
ncbi:SatD family protein [Pedobacter sp. SYSU D00535]|uniref:SatD family protein n=1 Tax=Pedobacter sp. SYSU D00535 TaxID=2810308 RepID=UPI001A95D7D3|nr:SatD family protein [Pedobacter sp. SYSU D00535]